MITLINDANGARRYNDGNLITPTPSTSSTPNLVAPTIKQNPYNQNDIYAKAMQNVSSSYGTPPSAPSVPQQRQSLNYDQAQQQASQQLGYQYDTMNKTALQALRNDQIRRGIFGQTDASQIEYNKAADLEAQKSSAVANLANSLMQNDQQASSRDYGNALQQYQLQYQAATKPYELAEQQRQSQFNNLSKLWDMSQSKDQSDFNKKLQEAIMTGRFYLE
jgi:hypothetical protein